MKFDTDQDFFDFVEAEGGVLSAIEWGLEAEDLPDNAPMDVIEAWKSIESALHDLNTIELWWDRHR